MFDSSGILVGILLVVCNVTNGKDVFLSLDTEILVDRNTLVLFQLEATSFQELGGGGDSDSKDEQICRNVVGVLECDGADLLRIGFCVNSRYKC
jgi:hypothetical protein